MVGVAGGAPGAFLEGGGKVVGLQIFVEKAGVEAVAAGGGVEGGDFFGWAGGELAASRCEGGLGTAGYDHNIVKFLAFLCYSLLERLFFLLREGSAEFFFIDFYDVWNGRGKGLCHILTDIIS